MKTKISFLFLITITLGFKIMAQNAPSPYQIAIWPDFREAAISYTFDDGCPYQFTKAIPIFDEFGYKLTLFTVSDWTTNWPLLKSVAANGHEVANHSKTHANFSQISPEKQEDEVRISNDIINANIKPQKSITMAYPYCVTGKDSIFEKYFIAVRGCQGFIEPKTPGSFMNISSVICGDKGPVIKEEHFKERADEAALKNGWLVYLLHGVDNDGGYSPIASETLKASLVYLKNSEGRFWVNTFGNVAKYIKERDGATIKETSVKAKKITLELTDNLDNKTFDYPLTIRRVLPEGWEKVVVSQKGIKVKNSIIEINSVKYIQFDAIPDGGKISLKKISGQ